MQYDSWYTFRKTLHWLIIKVTIFSKKNWEPTTKKIALEPSLCIETFCIK